MHISSWRGVGSSHQGLVRSSNQDAILIDNHVALWAVADGMGGHPGGDVASRLAIDTIAGLSHVTGALTYASIEQRIQHLRDLVEAAHCAILQGARARPELTGMGTTLVVLQIALHPAPTAIIVHEGDSRAYLLRQGTLRPLTRDHSVVEDYVRQGTLTRTQALYHPERHVLSRALGLGLRSDVDVTTELLASGDLLLLCTDGLTKMIHDEHIRQRMEACRPDPEAICSELIHAALAAGGLDNITVAVVGES